MKKHEKLTCGVCGVDIVGEYMQAKVDKNSNPTDNGAVVCSKECAKEYESDLPHSGRPIQHWSRITGYYQNVDGWNKGKRQELKERLLYGV